eukprot:3190882-Lingulodinium_polyedra.AAC.1
MLTHCADPRARHAALVIVGRSAARRLDYDTRMCPVGALRASLTDATAALLQLVAGLAGVRLGREAVAVMGLP